jgi:hypothetical protein
MDAVRRLHRQHAGVEPVRGKRFTIKGISMVITNGRRITRGTDDYDLTEPYRHVASVP